MHHFQTFNNCVIFSCNATIVNLQRIYDTPSVSIQNEILRCPEYIDLHRFYDTPIYVNLQRYYDVLISRFFDTPSMSTYRVFMIPRVCQFTEVL